ncbi:MAG: ABC transporter permease [Coriobacteriales bacterium]|jgi:ABC-2 type transport system permease protein|nr:ABC transporter permease [Coriobacteriales bacterium]
MAYSKEKLKKDGFILSMLVSRDFKLKYRRSILGILWSVLNPLLMMMVLAAVFSFVFRFDIENFALYLILGQSIFNLMSSSTSSGVTSIINAAPLIKKIRVNKLVFPLEAVLFELLNFALSLIAVLIVMIFYRIAPTLNLVFLPLLLIYVLIFCVGLSLLLSALAVFFRDVIYLWSVVLIAWTYATPLFYPIELLSPLMQRVMEFNPMYHYVTYFREIALWGITPGLTENLICLGMALVVLGVGFLVFRRTERKFILYV